jgi:hypothetical protein
MGEAKRRAQQHFERQAPEHRLGDAPIETEYHQKMVEIAGMLDEAFNGQRGGPGRKTGFVLMVFPFGDTSGRCNYISNGADRRDIIVLMKEMISRFSGRPTQSGRA